MRHTLERMSGARMAQMGQFARNVLPIIREVQAAGYSTVYIRDTCGQSALRKIIPVVSFAN
jgi:hypothetical protein